MITLASPLTLDSLRSASFANIAVLDKVGIVEVALFNEANEQLEGVSFDDENEAVDFALSLGLPDEAINYTFLDVAESDESNLVAN